MTLEFEVQEVLEPWLSPTSIPWLVLLAAVLGRLVFSELLLAHVESRTLRQAPPRASLQVPWVLSFYQGKWRGGSSRLAFSPDKEISGNQ